MCIIAACQPHVTPDEGDLDIACANNPDGFGWALATRDGIETHHTLYPVEAIDTFLEARTRAPEAWALFHARIATHSAVNLDGCHPFVVGGDPRVVVAHNGMLPCEPGPYDLRSDTRMLAEDIIPANGGVESIYRHPDVWGRWMGTQNKIVLLTVLPDAPRMTIINASQGHCADGVWWSNRTYQWLPPVTQRQAWTPTDGELWGKCEMCNTWDLLDLVDGMEICVECVRTLGLSARETDRGYCDACGAYVPTRELTQSRGEVICSDCDRAILTSR